MIFDYYIYFNVNGNVNPHTTISSQTLPSNITFNAVNNNKAHFIISLPPTPNCNKLNLQEKAVKDLIKWFKNNFNGILNMTRGDIK